MHRKSQPCDWCVGAALAVFALSIAIIFVSTIVITAEVVPPRCVRIGYSMNVAGDCQ